MRRAAPTGRARLKVVLFTGRFSWFPWWIEPNVPGLLRTSMRVGEGLIKSFSSPGAGAPMSPGMADLDESIVQEYGPCPLGQAGSGVANWTVGRVVLGAILGAVPALLHHHFLAHGAGKFAVLLGAIAGGIAGRAGGE